MGVATSRAFRVDGNIVDLRRVLPRRDAVALGHGMAGIIAGALLSAALSIALMAKETPNPWRVETLAGANALATMFDE